MTVFVEGVLNGILVDEKVGDLEKCIEESIELERLVAQAMADFEKETFESIREGLEEIGKATKMIPEVIKECKIASKDF